MNISSKPLSRVKILIPILVVLIIAFNFTPIGDSVKDLYLSISSPLQASFWSRGVSIRTNQNQDFDFERSAMVSRIVDLERKVSEMEELREALDLELENEFNFLDSRVVGKGVERDYLIIARGSNDGVVEGMPVITSSKNLVGEVVSTLDKFSHVKLISHPETSFDAKVLDKENSLGLIESNDKLNLKMIDRSADIEKGDMVVTYPGGGIYPGGLFIGEIEEVVRDDAETFQSAIIQSGFSPNQFSLLFVITDF